MLKLILLAVSFAPQFEAHKPHHDGKPKVYPSAQSEAPAAVQAAPVYYVAGDPYNFGQWLNGQRAARGLHPLAYDANLASLAQANSSRGFGHFGFNPGRENAGMGSLEAVEYGWLCSPAHASALFDPNVTCYGIAQVGPYWTFNAR